MPFEICAQRQLQPRPVEIERLIMTVDRHCGGNTSYEDSPEAGCLGSLGSRGPSVWCF